MIICFGVAGFWLVVFGFSFWRDRRLSSGSAILHAHRYLNGGICLLITAGAITQHV